MTRNNNAPFSAPRVTNENRVLGLNLGMTINPTLSNTIFGALQQNRDFWRKFYANYTASGKLRHSPSPFAKWCLENHFNSATRILELGCGNGRDSFAFLYHDLPVIAVDGSEIAIADNLDHLAKNPCRAEAYFESMDFSRIESLQDYYHQALSKVNTIYSRFVLHAIPENVEDIILNFATNILPVGSKMWHEFRTVRDPLMIEGEALSDNERFTDHYRRFLDPDNFRSKLEGLGWEEIYFIEANGLASFGNEDPVVARVGAIRK